MVQQGARRCPHPNSSVPNGASRQAFRTTRPEGAGLPWGTSCQGEGWLGSPALPAMALSGWFPPQPPGAGGALPGLWLDKGYSLQELKISLLKKKGGGGGGGHLGTGRFFPWPVF